jgi:SAM-dependent methyltransferase
MSEASREIAEARAKARGLEITFITGDLLTAPDHGPFDYIDCCGVLHHLPDPDAGFAALARALAPDGGMGLMVYAPHGRSGVYPLQDAFGTLMATDTPADKVRLGKAALASLPDSHPFKVNAHLRDHNDSDAGFHDLLLHSRDRAYSIKQLSDALDRAGLGLVSCVESIRYDPARYLPDTPEMAERIKALKPLERMAVAEQLAGNIKTHVVYAAPAKRASKCMARPTKPDLVPHVTGVAPGALAKQIMDKGRMTASFDNVSLTVDLPKDSGVMLGRVNNVRTLGQMSAGEDWMAFSALWGPVHRALTGFNLLHYSVGASR